MAYHNRLFLNTNNVQPPVTWTADEPSDTSFSRTSCAMPQSSTASTSDITRNNETMVSCHILAKYTENPQRYGTKLYSSENLQYYIFYDGRKSYKICEFGSCFLNIHYEFNFKLNFEVCFLDLFCMWQITAKRYHSWKELLLNL